MQAESTGLRLFIVGWIQLLLKNSFYRVDSWAVDPGPLFLFTC